MNFSKMSSEEQVLHYLKANNAKEVSLVHDIEKSCPAYWNGRGVYRAASTYRRAFQRLLSSGQLGKFTYETMRGRRHGVPFNYRVYTLNRKVGATAIGRFKPIRHGRN